MTMTHDHLHAQSNDEVATLKARIAELERVDTEHTVQIAKMNAYIRELEESQRWRKCSEELPELGERVQCYMPKAELQISIMRLGPDDPEDGGSQWLDDDDKDDVVGYVLGSVTHWKPLPEAPEVPDE